MQLNKLAIISDCIHSKSPDGRVGTDNHVFLRQIEALADRFEETILCCPFVESEKIKQLSYYTNSKVNFFPLSNAGGENIRDKIALLLTMPKWFAAFKKMNHWADIIYQRFPNNLNVPGIFYFYLKQKKVLASYTGDWYNYKGEPFTYRLQKFLLKKMFSGPVGIFFDTQKNDTHLFKTFSPSYTTQDWLTETDRVKEKKDRFSNGIYHTPVYITVGKLSPKKNQQFILDGFKILHEEGIDFRLYVVGDGPLYTSYNTFVVKHGLTKKIFIAGKKNPEELKILYKKADFLIHASCAEGYVKVPVEGFFHGVIPILSNISITKEIIGHNEERGFTFSITDKEAFVALIKRTIQPSEIFAIKITLGREYARGKTIESWATSFLNKVFLYYHAFV